jgi:hypothetical protein
MASADKCWHRGVSHGGKKGVDARRTANNLFVCDPKSRENNSYFSFWALSSSINLRVAFLAHIAQSACAPCQFLYSHII